jgi:hypothetical protein
MDFQTYAVTETSTLLDRLLARRSADSQQQLHAVREALEAAARALEAPVAAEEEIFDVVGRLTEAANASIQEVRDQARAEIDAANGEIRAHLAEIERLRAEAARTEADVARLQDELGTAQERSAVANRDLDATIEAHATLEAALRAAEAESEQAREARLAAEAQLSDARAAIDLMLVETEQLRAACESLAAEGESIRSDLAQAREAGHERDTFAAEVQAAAERVHTLEGELAGARQQRDMITAELEARTARIETLEGDAAGLREAREQRDAVTSELEASIARIEALESTHRQQEDQIRQLEARLDQAAKTEAQLRQQASGGARQHCGADHLQDDVEALRGEVDRMVSLFDASARAVSEMAAASSSGELLVELVKRLSLQFSRVALFRVKGNRLEGEHQIGFDDTTDMSKLVIPTAVESMLTRAIASSTVQSLAGDDVAVRSGTPFGGNPTSAVALPIALQGTPLAVVYADDSDMPDSARGPAIHESSVGFARLLVGQVVVLLVRHAHELKTLAELTQYATTLLQEAKEMYLADAEAGKHADLLRSRLKENIDCASQLYAYRAAMEGEAAAALLDQQIAAEIEGSSPFARDLAAVVREMASSDVQLTAEAS